MKFRAAHCLFGYDSPSSFYYNEFVQNNAMDYIYNQHCFRRFTNASISLANMADYVFHDYTCVSRKFESNRDPPSAFRKHLRRKFEPYLLACDSADISKHVSICRPDSKIQRFDKVGFVKSNDDDSFRGLYFSIKKGNDTNSFAGDYIVTSALVFWRRYLKKLRGSQLPRKT